MRITIVEDNIALSKGIKIRLEQAGHVVTEIADGVDADEFLQTNNTDILILDINLPRYSGLEILQRIRARGKDFPVLLLTARGSTEDRVKGLDLGADDYLVKPFEVSELEARVRALSRRAGTIKTLTEAIGRLEFSYGARNIIAEGEVLDVPRRELALFECLIGHRGILMSKSQIAEHIFGLEGEADEKAIETYVSRLRKRIAPFGVSIKSARGLGYMIDESKES